MVIRSKLGQRIGGVFMALLGTGFTVWMWYTFQTEGTYWPKASALFPAFAILGLTMLLFPIDAKELHEKHGVKKVERLEHYPLAWKIAIVVALFAGLANLLTMELLAR